MLKTPLAAFLLTVLIAGCAAPGSSSSAYPNPLPALPPPTCPVTRPPDPPFVPPPPAPAQPPATYKGLFWYGSPDLWTMLNGDGIWKDLPQEGGYSEKTFWWRLGYSASTEPKPALTVIATRLDATAPMVSEDNATNASADFGQAMLVGLTLPTAGCWQITGQYHGHELSFAVWVAP